MTIAHTRNGDAKDHGRFTKMEYQILLGALTTFIWAPVGLIAQ